LNQGAFATLGNPLKKIDEALQMPSAGSLILNIGLRDDGGDDGGYSGSQGMRLVYVTLPGWGKKVSLAYS